MSYVPKQKRWIKQYQGKSYSVSCKQLGTGAGKDASWLAANSWWERKQAELEIDQRGDAEEAKWVAQRQNIDAVLTNPLAALGCPDTVPLWPANYTPSGSVDERSQQAAELLAQRIEGSKPPQEEAVRTCQAQADNWLAELKVSVGIKQISVGRYGSYRVQIKPFVAFIGPDTDVAAITAARLERYWFDQANLVSDGKLAQATAKGRWMAAKQFVKRLAERGTIPLPGNIASRRLKFTDPPKVIETMTVAEVLALVKGCDKYNGKRRDIGKVKLFLLLMLNCGMYQGDVADLGVNEVDLQAGTILRPRSKTPGGPVVRYKLWPETLRLLRQYGEVKSTVIGPRGPRILLSQRGTPLVIDKIIANGGTSKIDLVRDAVVALCGNIGVEKKPLKLIRKTSATMVADHPTYKNYVDLFLGHTPSKMSERHSANYSQTEFDEAVDWLRTKYGL
jgi:integrase